MVIEENKKMNVKLKFLKIGMKGMWEESNFNKDKKKSCFPVNKISAQRSN